MIGSRNPNQRFVALLVTMLLHVSMPGSALGQAGPPAHMEGMNMDRIIRKFVLAEQLELHANAAERPFEVEAISWIGGDYRRLFLRLQGEQSTVGSNAGELQADILFGRLISPFWSAVAGVRIDTRPTFALHNGAHEGVTGRDRLTRGALAVGFVGIAPGWFEMEPTLYVSEKGDVSFEFETAIDMLFTQRLILQPRFELNAAVQAVPEIGIGSGINDVEIGARLRYEIHRKFAPYVGVSLLRRTGATAALAHDLGESRSIGTVMVGVRVWR